MAIFSHFLPVLFLFLFLSGCGGGGSGGGSRDDDVNGIWWQPGTSTVGMISNDGWDVDFIGSFGHLSGRLLSRDGVVYDSIVTSFWGGSIREVLFATEGTAVPKAAIDVTYEGQFTLPITLDLVYDPLSDRPSSLSRISGIWSRVSGEHVVTIVIDNTGTLFGNDTNGCVYTGSVSVPDGKLNNYRIDMDVSGCERNLQDGRGQGVLLDTALENDTLLLAVVRRTEPSAIESITMQLTRQ